MPNALFCRSLLLTRTARRTARRIAVIALLAFGIVVTSAPTASAQSEFTVDGVLEAIVQVVSKVPAEARTARTLGTNRDGSGVVIDSNGLILTIGYAILQAESSEIVMSNGKRVAARGRLRSCFGVWTFAGQRETVGKTRRARRFRRFSC